MWAYIIRFLFGFVPHEYMKNGRNRTGKHFEVITTFKNRSNFPCATFFSY